MRAALASMLALASAACAPAAPAWIGGRTTPRARSDLALGAAARVPLGDLAPREIPSGAQELLAFAEPGGLAPVGFVRHGLAGHWALGALVSSSTLRLELLGEARLSPLLRVVGGVAPYGGFVWSEPRQGTGGGEGWRVGALAPLAIAFDALGVLEGWFGARAGFEHAEGSVGAEGMRAPGHLTAWRAGIFLGLGLGLRPVHVLAELVADYEFWRGALAGIAIERMGVALTPGFALRMRL